MNPVVGCNNNTATYEYFEARKILLIFYERQYNYQVTAALWCCLLKFNDDVMEPANTFNEISNTFYILPEKILGFEKLIQLECSYLVEFMIECHL